MDKFYIYHLFKIIEEAHEAAYTYYGVDLKAYENLTLDIDIKYDQIYKLCMDNIQKARVNSINFWQTLLNENPNNLEIISEGKALIERIKKVNLYANKLFAYPGTNFHLLVKLLYFQLYVANNEKAVFEIVKMLKVKSFNIKINEELAGPHGVSNIFQSVKVSLEMNNIGRIIDTSFEIHSIVGYSRQELIGKLNHIIIPVPIRERHSMWMRRFLENMSGALIGTNTSCFLYNKNCHYVNIQATARTIPNFLSGIFQCIFYITKIPFQIHIYDTVMYAKNKPFCLLLDLNNNIFGHSKYASRYMVDNLWNEVVNISDIIDYLERELMNKLESDSGIVFKLKEIVISISEEREEMDQDSEITLMAWGRIEVMEYGVNGHPMHMGYKVLSMVLINNQYELQRFTHLMEHQKFLFQESESSLFDISHMSHMSHMSHISHSHSSLLLKQNDLNEEDKGEEEILLGHQAPPNITPSTTSSHENNLLLYKERLGDQLGISRNKWLQLLIYASFILMTIIMISGYIYINQIMEMNERNFKLLEKSSLRLDRGGASIPLASVNVKNLIEFKQFLFDDETMDRFVAQYAGYFSKAGILLEYHNAIQMELTDKDQKLWDIERTPVSIKELNKNGEVTILESDLTTLLNMVAQRLWLIGDMLNVGWAKLKAQYLVDNLFDLRRELYFQVQNGYEISRIQINLAINKYIDHFIQKNEREINIIYLSIILIILVSLIIYLIVLIKIYKILQLNAKALALYAYIPEENIAKLINKLYDFNISNIWSPNNSEDFNGLFDQVLLEIGNANSEESNILPVLSNSIKEKVNIENNEEDEKNEDKKIKENKRVKYCEDRNMNLKENKLVNSEQVINNSPIELIELEEINSEDERIGRKAQHLCKMNKKVVKRVILLAFVLIICFVAACSPHLLIILSLTNIFDEAVVFVKIFCQRRPYLISLLTHAQMTFQNEETAFLESDADFAFDYYYDNLYMFEDQLIDFQNKGSRFYSKLIRTIEEFNNGAKYLEYLTTQEEYFAGTTKIRIIV